MLESCSAEGLDPYSSYQSFYFDNQLGVSCAFAPAADGMQRCLPSAPEFDQLTYQDAACKQPVVQLGYGCQQDAKYAIYRASMGACSAPPVVYALGDLVTPTALYTKSGADRVAGAAPTRLVRILGAEIPAKSLVEHALETD